MKNKVAFKNHFQTKQLLIAVIKGPHTHALQRPTIHKNSDPDQHSPPMMLQYESTPTWSEEEQTTSKGNIEQYTMVQQMQLQKCINEAQQIQWQHEDNTFIQKKCAMLWAAGVASPCSCCSWHTVNHRSGMAAYAICGGVLLYTY